MKLEDDEGYEAPEPGEIVDEPEGKPVSGPVLSAPPPSPLPSLEALIRPRQDLVPQQRTFPLPSSAGAKQTQATGRGSARLLHRLLTYAHHKRARKHEYSANMHANCGRALLSKQISLFGSRTLRRSGSAAKALWYHSRSRSVVWLTSGVTCKSDLPL